MNEPISNVVGGKRQGLADITWPEYQALCALNGSVLVHGRKSVVHLKYAWDNGREDTDAMQFGRMIHCLLFEPREIEKRYRAWGRTRRGTEYEEFCEEASAAGAEVVKETGQYSLEQAIAAAQSFLRSKRVQALIAAGRAEQTVLAIEHGLQCKGRLDWVSSSEHILTDLKTAASIEDRLFGKAFFNFGYDIKLGLYRRWLNKATNDNWPVEVIALENSPPYDLAVIPIPDAVLDRGVEKGLGIIENVVRCIEEDCWPGVAGDDPYPLHVPFYEMEQEETEEFQG